MSFLRAAFGAKHPFVLRVAIIAAIGGFLFGYGPGIVDGALLYIKQDLPTSQFQQRALAGVLLLGAVAGAAISGWSSGRIRRKGTKVVSGSIYVIGGLGSAFAPSVTWLIVARGVLAPAYLATFALKGIGIDSWRRTLGMAVFHRTVPETKGRSLEEIEHELGADTADAAFGPAATTR